MVKSKSFWLVTFLVVKKIVLLLCGDSIRVRRGDCEYVLGGRDCLSFSTFSESFKTNVYKCLWQRTLNLTWEDFLLRLMRAAVSGMLVSPNLLQCLPVLSFKFRNPSPNPCSFSLALHVSPQPQTPAFSQIDITVSRKKVEAHTRSILASSNLNELYANSLAFHSQRRPLSSP